MIPDPEPDLSLITGAELRAIRLQRAESQHVFWQRLGVRQNTGSHYETGIQIPKPVQMLAWMHYEIGIPLDPTLLRAAAGVIAEIASRAQADLAGAGS